MYYRGTQKGSPQPTWSRVGGQGRCPGGEGPRAVCGRMRRSHPREGFSSRRTLEARGRTTATKARGQGASWHARGAVSSLAFQKQNVQGGEPRDEAGDLGRHGSWATTDHVTQLGLYLP